MAKDKQGDIAAPDVAVGGAGGAATPGKRKRVAPNSKYRPNQGRWVARYEATLGDGMPSRARTSSRWFSKAKQEIFFETLANSMNIKVSAAEAGVHRETIAFWRKYNAEFRQRVADVLSEAYLDAEARMLAMAIDGVRRTATSQRTDKDTVTTTYEGDDPRLVLGLMRLHHQTVSVNSVEQAGALAHARRPSDEQLADWLLADIEAAEAELRGDKPTEGVSDDAS